MYLLLLLLLMLSLLLFRIILFNLHLVKMSKKSNRVVLCDCCKSNLMIVNKYCDSSLSQSMLCFSSSFEGWRYAAVLLSRFFLYEKTHFS